MRRCWLLLALLIGQAALAEVAVTDMAGREVRLPAPAQRIVALAPHIVENVFSAGAGDRLVGAVAFSDYPQAARRIERVGNFQSWSLEKVLALRPDLVLLWGSADKGDSVTRLQRLGIPAYVSEPRALQDIPATIRAIATLAGTRDTGEREAQRLESAFAELQRRYGARDSLSLFYQIWHQPLQTVNGQHMISQVMALCGARNIFSELEVLAPRVSVEAVLNRDPDVILASGMDQARPEWLDAWRRFPQLSAVTNQRLLFIPPDHLQRPTARLLLGARSLCRQLWDGDTASRASAPLK